MLPVRYHMARSARFTMYCATLHGFSVRVRPQAAREDLPSSHTTTAHSKCCFALDVLFKGNPVIATAVHPFKSVMALVVIKRKVQK